MTLTRPLIVAALARVLSTVPDAEFRLVGTASCLLRGIDLPVGDIDILFRHRTDVDDWFACLQVGRAVVRQPRWLPGEAQYYAELVVDDVKVGLSTVEWDSEVDGIECFGPGPWRHLVELDIDGFLVPAVAVELRLISEIVRGRPDRVGPIVEYLRARGCDVDLVRRGLRNRGVEGDDISCMIDQLSRGGGP